MFQDHFPIPSGLSIKNTRGQLDCSECIVVDMVLEWHRNIHCYYSFECCTRDGTILQNLLGCLRADNQQLRVLFHQNWIRWNSPGEPNLPKVDREAPTLGRRCIRLGRIHSADLGCYIIMNCTRGLLSYKN